MLELSLRVRVHYFMKYDYSKIVPPPLFQKNAKDGTLHQCAQFAKTLRSLFSYI